MPIYEFRCRKCSNITSVFVRQYVIPESAQCESCGSTKTEKAVSLTNHRVAFKPKYSEDFTEKSLPFLKSRKEFKRAFEENPKESDEAKAFEINEKIGERMDRVITKQISDMGKDK
ncbi:MAG: zinc ribbon domain-containing protein [Dehalococcoidia bacterium]